MTPQLGEHCKLNVYISLSFVHFGLKQNSILNHFRDNLYSAFFFLYARKKLYRNRKTHFSKWSNRPVFTIRIQCGSLNSRGLATFRHYSSFSVVKNLPANAGDMDWVPGLGRSPGGGNGNLLVYSCLENSMDRGA